MSAASSHRSVPSTISTPAPSMYTPSPAPNSITDPVACTRWPVTAIATVTTASPPTRANRITRRASFMSMVRPSRV